MWRVGGIILPALFAQATTQNPRNNWVDVSESKLSTRAHKAEYMQDLDSTMLMKVSAMPQQRFMSTVVSADASKSSVPKMAGPQVPFFSKGSFFANRIRNDHLSHQPMVHADHDTMQAIKSSNIQDLTSSEKHFSPEQQAFLPERKLALFLMVAQAIVQEAMMPSKST